MARYTLMVNSDYDPTSVAEPFVTVEADSLDLPPKGIEPVDPTDVRHVDVANDLTHYSRCDPDVPTGALAHGYGYFTCAN